MAQSRGYYRTDFFHKTGVTLVGRRMRMDMRILCALVWLSIRNMSIHVPQAKEQVFLYKLVECKRPRMTGLPAIPRAPNDKYSYLFVEFTPELRLVSLSRF